MLTTHGKLAASISDMFNDAVSMEPSILYLKGLPVKISVTRCISIHEYGLYHSKQCNAVCDNSSGASLLANEPVYRLG